MLAATAETRHPVYSLEGVPEQKVVIYSIDAAFALRNAG